MSTAWQVPQLTSDRVLQQLLRRRIGPRERQYACQRRVFGMVSNKCRNGLHTRSVPLPVAHRLPLHLRDQCPWGVLLYEDSFGPRTPFPLCQHYKQGMQVLLEP
jgi:hypothetical protein